MRLLLTTLLILSVASISAAANESSGFAGENLSSASVEVQDDASNERNPREYFPTAGDFSIGFDSSPFLNYLGNMFNGTTNNSLNLGDNTLHFRYHITDNTAARLSLRINTMKEVDKHYVDDEAAQAQDPLSRAQVEDRRTVLTHNYEVKAGYLMFRGENRLRGFFGGDIFFGYGKERSDFNYGNQMTEVNPAPESVVNWNSGATANQNMRVLEYNSGSEINLGLGAFVGAEYYFAPKISLGAELGLVYAHTFLTQENGQTENMVGSMHVVDDIEVEPGKNEWATGTTFPYTFGNLYLLISF